MLIHEETFAVAKHKVKERGVVGEPVFLPVRPRDDYPWSL